MVNETILNIYPGTQNHGEANLIEFYTEKNYYIYTYIIMYIYKSVLYATPRTVTRHSPLFMGILQARILEWIVMPSSRGIFLTQESNPGLPHCRWILLSPESPRKPIYMHNYQKMEQYPQFANKWGKVMKHHTVHKHNLLGAWAHKSERILTKTLAMVKGFQAVFRLLSGF